MHLLLVKEVCYQGYEKGKNEKNKSEKGKRQL